MLANQHRPFLRPLPVTTTTTTTTFIMVIASNGDALSNSTSPVGNGKAMSSNSKPSTAEPNPSWNDLYLDYYKVRMASASDGWIVGADGAIRRYTGSEWVAYRSPVTTTLRSVYPISDTAQQVAATCNPADVRGWVRYTIRTSGLKSRAGFVLAMLRLGEAPPDVAADYHLPSFKPPVAGDEHQTSANNFAASDGVERLTAASALEIADLRLQTADCELPDEDYPDTGTGTSTDTNTDSSDNTKPPAPSHQHSALWLAAREELAQRVTGPAWGLWLKHVQLVAVEGDTW